MDWLKGLEDSIGKINNGESFKVIDEANKAGYDLVVDEIIDLDNNETTYEMEVSKNNKVIFSVKCS